jgi:transcriptional regulator with XRE-family HTH domain
MAGLTQSQLADGAGTVVSTISDLERGGNENPGYALVMRIVATLQRSGLRGLRAEDVFPVSDTEVA